MLAELRRNLPRCARLPGLPRRYRCPTAAVDAALCGQALHWFNLERALPEIARVLVPGGTLGGLWNSDDDRVDWVAGLQEAADGAASPSLSRRRSEAASWGPEQFGRALFTPTERAEFPNAQRLTADSLVSLIGTHSQVLVMEPGDTDPLLARSGPIWHRGRRRPAGVRPAHGHLGDPRCPPVTRSPRSRAAITRRR